MHVKQQAVQVRQAVHVQGSLHQTCGASLHQDVLSMLLSSEENIVLTLTLYAGLKQYTHHKHRTARLVTWLGLTQVLTFAYGRQAWLRPIPHSASHPVCI